MIIIMHAACKQSSNCKVGNASKMAWVSMWVPLLDLCIISAALIYVTGCYDICKVLENCLVFALAFEK